MGRKPIVHGFAILNAVDATATQTSASTNVETADKISIHCLFSASNSGEFKVFARNGANDAYYQLSFNATMTITAQTECQILLLECPFSDIQLQWVPSAGSGTLTATISTKVVGA